MKKLLLLLGSPPDTAHPSIDCLLAASQVIHQEKGSRFLVIAHAGDNNSIEELKNAVQFMLHDSPGSVKILYIDCSPSDEVEVNFLLQQSPTKVCVYIFDHHENSFMCSLTAAPNISYTCNGMESTAAMTSQMYYRSKSNDLWIKILTLQHILSFHEVMACDSLCIENTPVSCLLTELIETYNGSGLFKSSSEQLFYITRHILDFADSLDWAFSRSPVYDRYDRTGQFLDKAITTRDFMEQLINGNDDHLFTKPHIDRYRSRTNYWCQLIASSSLVSILTGESVNSRFIGAILVRPHQSRGYAGLCWMNPECANALSSRSKTVCLIDATWKEKSSNEVVRVNICRASSHVNCLEIGLALAKMMSPEIVNVTGYRWRCLFECSAAAYNHLEGHLKICRKAVEFTNARPLPQPVIRSSTTIKRPSRQVSHRKSGQNSLMGGRRSLAGSLTPQSKHKPRRSIFMSLGSDTVFDN